MQPGADTGTMPVLRRLEADCEHLRSSNSPLIIGLAVSSSSVLFLCIYESNFIQKFRHTSLRQITNTLLPKEAQHVSATNKSPTDRRLQRLETPIIPAQRDAVEPGSAIGRLFPRGIIRSRTQRPAGSWQNMHGLDIRAKGPGLGGSPQPTWLNLPACPIPHESSILRCGCNPCHGPLSPPKGLLVWNIPLFHLLFLKVCPERLSLLNRAGASGVGHLAYSCRCQRSRCSFCGNKVHG